jgi:tetratricopeptide (TPR) repeat protein
VVEVEPLRGVLVGRAGPRRRLGAALDAALAGHTRLVMVTGEAGIGKTTLIRTITTAAEGEAMIGWGTCWDGGVAPGYWPWAQALGAVVDCIGSERAVSLASDDADLLTSILPALGRGSRHDFGDSAHARFALFDAISRWLSHVAAVRPTVLVLDDLHWADQSSLELLDFVSRSVHSAPLLILGAHRPDELDAASQALLRGVAARGDHIPLDGLSLSEVCVLVAELAGPQVATESGRAIHRRSGGHPLFVRELASLGDAAGGESQAVPAMVREAIARRLARADSSTHSLLQAAAVVGQELTAELLGSVLGWEADQVDRAIDSGVALGVLLPALGGLPDRFAHDLFRESVYYDLPSSKRTILHHRVAVALAARAERHGDVAPGELARHFIAALPSADPECAVEWALNAAATESAALAFNEAAAHLSRLRRALAEVNGAVSDATSTDILVAEADALSRAGDPAGAKQLLLRARHHARRCPDGDYLAKVAFGVQHLGSRFGMPRPDIVAILQEARDNVADDSALAARLTAAIARELQHSIAEDRSEAPRLSSEALELARRTGDAATLAVCLLARHDVLWTPGSAVERLSVAQEIVSLATTVGDEEQRVEGLLLVANALLESGSPAFRPALQGYLTSIAALGQPRHRYLAMTRQAALALLDGRLDVAAELIESAAAFGENIREPDAGNVRRAQLLELTRARGDPEEQRAFAAEAVKWWVGMPGLAHAVAAGLLARAGDLNDARHHVNTLRALGSWQADRSYMASTLLGNLADAAIALGDTELCAEILDELKPVASSCGVNGAVVAFAGSHAHFAGLVAVSLGRTEEAVKYLQCAVEVHEQLAAVTWEAASRAALAAAVGRRPTLRRRQAAWEITYRSEAATVADSKGVRDLAVLLRRPGVEVHVLELSGSPHDCGAPIEMADRMALARYRQRLVDLDEDIAEAELNNDTGRLDRAESEREALLAELRSVTGLGGSARLTGARAAERARKAVSARIKDAVRHLEQSMPQLADHLNRSIVTGAWCHYRVDMSESWIVET